MFQTNKPTFELKRLDPMEAGGVQLLQAEIDRLNEENSKLKDRLKQVEDRVSTYYKLSLRHLNWSGKII